MNQNQIMKLTPYIPLLFGAVLIALSTPSQQPVQAQGQTLAERIKALNAERKEPVQHEAVLFWGYPTFSGGKWDGAIVYASSGSRGAPQFPQFSDTNHIQMGQAVADAMTAGFHFTGMIDTSDGITILMTH